MEIRVLGPVEIYANDRVFPVGPPQQRLVLAALAFDVNRTVTVEALIDRVWDEAPNGARRTLHVLLTRLRRLLTQADEAQTSGAQTSEAQIGGAQTSEAHAGEVQAGETRAGKTRAGEVQIGGAKAGEVRAGETRAGKAGGGAVGLIRRSGGYALEIDPDRVDAHRLRGIVDAARAADTDGARLDLLREAVTVWRGEPLAGLSGQWATRTRQAWRQQHLDAVVGWADAELRVGDPGAVIGPVSELIVEYPLVEPLAAVQMRALTAVGRSTAALDEYARISTLLADELGVDPGHELQTVRLAVLRGGLTAARDSQPAARYTLPAPSLSFVGRAAEVDAIVAAASGPAMSVQAIDGMPGVGKTALAVHIGHRVVGELTDLRLFVDLHAHTAGRQPVRPTDALADLLTADGADPRYLPADLDGRAALWRARTAGRRVLLILDNAGATDQVVPLLPGAARGLTLVTSRRRLADLDAVTVSLDTLPVGEAQAMFIRLAPRAAGQGADVRELVELCGRLPLAIALSAGLFSKRNSWNVRNLIEETAPVLLTTRAETRTVAAAFDLSYQSLSPERQRFLRRLGAHPGVEYDRYAAAALSDVDIAEAAEHLHGLLDDHLLEEPAYQRFRMHDLVREYARTRAAGDPEADRERAVDRLLAYYRHAANQAEAQVARYTRCATSTWDTPPAVPDLTDRARALTWLRAERANLLACIASATAQGRDRWVVDLTAGVATLLFLDGPWSLAIDLHSAAAELADHLGDTAGQAGAHTNLGDIRGLAGQYPASIDHLHRALRLYRDLGDRVGEASALMYLGNVRSLTEGLVATGDLDRAYRIYREIGDRRGQAGALLALGIIRRLADDYQSAADDLTRALAIYHDLGDSLGRADVLAHLGVVHREVGDLPTATSQLEEALAIYRELDHELGQATVFVSLGVVRQLSGDYLEATGHLRRAMTGFRRVGHRFGLANALMWLGTVLRESGDVAGRANGESGDVAVRGNGETGDAAGCGDTESGDVAGGGIAESGCAAGGGIADTGDHVGAIDNLRQAVALYGELGYRQGQAYAMTRLGDQLRIAGDRAAAADNIHQALCVFRDLGVPAGEAEALNHRGALRRAEGDSRSALADHQEALRLARAVGSVLEEARALAAIELTGEREE